MPHAPERLMAAARWGGRVLARSRTFGWALAGVGAVILLGQLALWLPLHWQRTPMWNLDLMVYLRAAHRLAVGQPLYESCPLANLHMAPACFLYPPALAVLLRPLGGLSPQTFQRVLYAALLVAFWGYALGLVLIAHGRVTARRLLAAGAVLALCPGIEVTMSYGNVDVIVWALAALGLAAERWLPFLAGSAAIKVYPACALVTSVVRRPYHLRKVVLAVVGIAAAGALAAGPRAYFDWLTAAGPTLGAGTLYPSNVSLSMAGVRVAGRLGLVDLSGSTLPLGARAFLLVALLGGVSLVAYATRERSTRAQAAVVLGAAAWLSPICWWYYAPVLLIPAAAWLRSILPAPTSRI